MSGAVVILLLGKVSSALTLLCQVISLVKPDENFFNTISAYTPTDVYHFGSVRPDYALHAHAPCRALRE
jgi:hypothetical protein